tara:strand:+ start:3523 stop:4080 length:558 start_codon:yes stop_codon:yes gene_type:complete
LSSKSTFSNSTSKSYALALYQLAKESSELEKVENEMNSLKKLLIDSSDFREMILNPTIQKEEKKNIISAITQNNNFSKTGKKFLGFLTIKNRLFFLNQIIESFLNFLSNAKGELKAKLLSAKKLSKVDIEKIEKELSSDFNSPIKIDYKHEPSLIGGLIIQVGSVMVDNSIKNKLRQLEKSMIEA